MCDTLVALGNTTQDGSVLFAKNSDRQPNEPHIMIRIPRLHHDLSIEKNVKTTYIEIPQVEETYEVMLLKPSWIWGCEMGCNEFGLNIGNEAVFTKEKCEKPSLIGMDMVRIALERCCTAKEALDLIITLLETYGQGGNCGFEKPFEYHNSFLIADKSTAWVLETAGQYWVAKEVQDIYCISNCLSIGKEFDKHHADVIYNAIRHGWCRDPKDFDFAKCYSNPLITYVSGSQKRREASQKALESSIGHITVDTMKSTLRSHHAKLEGKLFEKPSLKSVCMHAGGLVGDHTTGSYVASLGKTCIYWVTGASTPCLSIFKPLWLSELSPLFCEADKETAIAYWKNREHLHRAVLGGLINHSSYMSQRNQIEEKLGELADSAGTDYNKQAEVMSLAHKIEQRFIDKMLNQRLEGSHMKIKGSVYFRHYWIKQNKGLA